MNLRKYQQGYLGSQSNTLDERVTQRCGGTQIPYPTYLVGNPDDALAITDRQKPRVASLDETRGLVLYTNASQSVLYYKVLTVGTDGTVTAGTEQTLLSSVGFIVSWAVCNIYDDKVLIAYKHTTGSTNTYCDVGTVDGSGNMTFATPTVIDTTHAPDSARGWYDLVKISDGRAIIGAANTDNSKAGLQIVDVDGADNITYGTVAKTGGVNKTTLKIGMLSTTAGVVGAGGVSVNTLATAEKFTISSTTIMFYGTEYTFTNTTQYPTQSDQFFIGDVTALSSNKISLTGGSTVTDGGDTTHAVTNMVLTDTSGVLTSATVLEDTDSTSFASSPTIITMSSYFRDSDVYLLTLTQLSPYTLRFVRHADADPPVYVSHEEVAANTLIANPDSTMVGTDYGINAWTENDGVNSWVAVNGVYFNPKA